MKLRNIPIFSGPKIYNLLCIPTEHVSPNEFSGANQSQKARKFKKFSSKPEFIKDTV